MDYEPSEHDLDDNHRPAEPWPASELPAAAQQEAGPEPPATGEMPAEAPYVPATGHLAPGAVGAGRLVIDGVSYRPAGCWWRMGAFLIDALVLGIAHRIMLLIIGYTTPDLDQMIPLLRQVFAEFMAGGSLSPATFNQLAEVKRTMIFAGWLNMATCAAYFTVFHGRLGATLGKLSLGLVVLRRDGAPLGYLLALLRYLCYLLSSRLAYTAWLIPLNRERRTLYDIVLGTNVFRIG